MSSVLNVLNETHIRRKNGRRPGELPCGTLGEVVVPDASHVFMTGAVVIVAHDAKSDAPGVVVSLATGFRVPMADPELRVAPLPAGTVIELEAGEL